MSHPRSINGIVPESLTSRTWNQSDWSLRLRKEEMFGEVGVKLVPKHEDPRKLPPNFPLGKGYPAPYAYP